MILYLTLKRGPVSVPVAVTFTGPKLKSVSRLDRLAIIPTRSERAYIKREYAASNQRRAA